MNGLIDFALRMAGMPENVLADLNKASPNIANLVVVAKKLQPIINKAQTLEQHVAAITPILKAAYPDFQAALPAIEELIAFATAKSQQ